jgi:hypothetical protein
LLAVSAVTVALPYLIEAFQGSKKALDDTKEAVNDLTSAYDRYLQKSKDAQTLIDEATKLEIARAKLMGKSEQEIVQITKKGVAERVSVLGGEINERIRLIDKLVAESNRLFEKGGEEELELSNQYSIEAAKLRRKNEETRLEIQKLGNSLVLADLEMALSNEEKAIKESNERRAGLFRDNPRFAQMGVPGFGESGGAFSGMFAGLADDLQTPEWAQATSSAGEALDNLGETLQTKGENVINIGSAIAAGFSNFGNGIANAIASGTLSVETAGATLLATLGDFMSSFGTSLIAWGVAKSVLDSLTISGPAAIAAGTALVIAGKALSASASKSLSNIANGGGSSSVGGSGSTSFSGSTVSSASAVNTGGRYVFEIEGTKLVGVLSNTLARNRALGTDLNFG